MVKKTKKGQLSIELIIILAVLLAVVFLVASKMRESASRAAESITNTSENVYGEINKISENVTASTAPAPSASVPLFIGKTMLV